MDPSEMFGMTDPEVGTGGPADFLTMQQPQQMDFQQYIRPATTPEEAGQRRSMWSEIVTRFQTNPNLQRALAMTGAMMMQPIRPGQTAMGQAGNAAMVGLNAYNVGEAAALEQSMKQASEQRAERQLGIAESREAREAGREPLHREGMEEDIKGKRAGTGATLARTELTEVQIDQAIADAKEKKDSAPLRELLRQVQQAEAEVKLGIPADARLAAELDRLKAERVKLQTAEAALAGTGASTRYNIARAEEQELTNEALKELPASERLRALGKGRAAGGSAVVQQYDMYAEAFDRLQAKDPNDPTIKGMNRDQFALKKLESGKASDAATLIQKLISTGEYDREDPLIKSLEAQAGRRAAVPGTGEPAPGAAEGTPAPKPGSARPGGRPAQKTGTKDNPVEVSTKEQRDALPKGTVYRGPDGKLREKK